MTPRIAFTSRVDLRALVTGYGERRSTARLFLRRNRRSVSARSVGGTDRADGPQGSGPGSAISCC